MATRATTAVRLALAALALLAIAWLALGLRASRALEQGERVKSRPSTALTPDALTDARRQLATAREHGPDADALLLEAELLTRAGREREAAELLDPLVEDEPRNVEALVVLAFAVKRSDPRRSAELARRARALSPLVPE